MLRNIFSYLRATCAGGGVLGRRWEGDIPGVSHLFPCGRPPAGDVPIGGVSRACNPLGGVATLGFRPLLQGTHDI